MSPLAKRSIILEVKGVLEIRTSLWPYFSLCFRLLKLLSWSPLLKWTQYTLFSSVWQTVIEGRPCARRAQPLQPQLVPSSPWQWPFKPMGVFALALEHTVCPHPGSFMLAVYLQLITQLVPLPLFLSGSNIMFSEKLSLTTMQQPSCPPST